MVVLQDMNVVKKEVEMKEVEVQKVEKEVVL